ncbi:MAG TPA: GntR family transcriptional regulator [bacterium]|nr:GntR family transcriptional regulator [bacterium]
MPSGKPANGSQSQALEPLSNSLPLGARVYQALLNSIVSRRIEPGAPLRPEAIARQLEVSTTPVREAMQRLESDGLAIKRPNQGWFVREHTKQEIKELYEIRAALESLSVRLACARITEDEITWLREHQSVGEAALAAGDMDAYRVYNRDLHAAIMRAARNSYLAAVMGQLQSQSEMLVARTIRIIGRPVRAIEEHHRLIELIAARDGADAGQLMHQHISSALEDILSYGLDGGGEPRRAER